jgi:hypothetical protein
MGTTTNAPLNPARELGDNPMVEKGGVALDVYILDAKEPLNFVPDQRFCVFCNDTAACLINLVYKLRFHPGEVNPWSDSARTVYDVISNESRRLTVAMDHIIDFQGTAGPGSER